MQSLTIAEPLHMARPDGPWERLEEDLARFGNAVVHTTWGEWVPAVLATPGLRGLLGRDWARYRRTPDPTVRQRFVTARLLIKFTAGVALGIPPDSVDLAYQLGGRPYLRGFDQIDMSLTHTGDLLAVGVSRIGRIGVDAEPADRRIRIDLLESQMCTPVEAAELARLPEAERRRHALRLWTLKEAYTKALGQGMRLGFTEFGFTGGGALLAPDGSPATRGEWGFATRTVLGRFLLSTACLDAGLDAASDTAVDTMLDPGFWAVMAERSDPGEPGV